MKRRFRIAGKERRRSGWLAGAAFAGLISIWVFGALFLVPQLELRDAAGLQSRFAVAAGQRELIDPQIDTVIESGPAAIDRGDMAAAQADRTNARPGAAAPTTTAASDASTSPAAGACVAAMNAALSNARIEFLSSSVEIVPASRNVISVLAALSHACPGRIEIAGHSDDLGSDTVNQQLSIARAQAVASAFIEFGVDPGRLTVLGFGSTQPVGDNATSAGRARNRRIEMSLLVDAASAEGGKEQ